MLTLNVDDAIKAEVQTFLEGVAFDPDVSKLTYDKALSAYWKALFENNQPALFSEEIIFGENGQPDQITEMYKMSLEELKESIEKPNSSVLIHQSDDNVISFNCIAFGEKRYLQILSPAGAEQTRQKYRAMLAHVEAEASKELSPWDKICHAFAKFFKKHPGKAYAQKEAYRKLQEQLQQNYNEADKTLTELEDSTRFSRRVSVEKQKQKYLEEQHLIKEGVEYNQKQQKEHEEYLKQVQEEHKLVNEKAEEILKEMEQKELNQQQNPSEVKEEPKLDEVDPLKPEDGQLQDDAPVQEQPNENDSKKISKEEYLLNVKATELAKAKLEQERIQKQLEEQRKKREEQEKRDNEEKQKRTDLRKKNEELKAEIVTLTKSLNEQASKKKTFDENLASVKKALLDSTSGLKKLEQPRQKALDTIKTSDVSIKKAQNEVERLTKELNSEKEKINNEKTIRDNLEQEYKNAQSRFDEQSKNWEAASKTGSLMDMEPEAYLTYIYQTERNARMVQFQEEQATREQNLKIIEDTMARNQQKIKEINDRPKQAKAQGRKLTDEEKELNKKQINDLDSLIKTNKADIKTRKTEISAAQKTFDTDLAKFDKENKNPSKDKIKDTLDNILIPGRQKFAEQAALYDQQTGEMTSKRDAFQAQDKIYQQKLSEFNQKEYEINEALSRNNGIIDVCTQNKNKANEKITKLDETKTTLENTIQQSQKMIPAAEAKSKELADGIQTTQNTLNQKTLEQKQVYQQYQDMVKAL